MTKHEAAARQAKASKMVAVLLAHGADSATVAQLPTRGRAIVAELAGCRTPSDATWQVVVEQIQARAS